jgi:hypothetical protein
MRDDHVFLRRPDLTAGFTVSPTTIGRTFIQLTSPLFANKDDTQKSLAAARDILRNRPKSFALSISAAHVGFTYSLQRSKKPASAIDSTERSAQVRSGSLTPCNGQRERRQPSIQRKDLLSSDRVHLLPATAKETGVSHRFNGQIYSVQVGFTYNLQRPKRPASAIDLMDRSAQLGSNLLTSCNGQRAAVLLPEPFRALSIARGPRQCEPQGHQVLQRT